MRINKLKINSYGKLKNKEIELKDGINIIYGKNESGKSTILKFIVNSFYGISKNKRGKEYSDLERYKPWVGEDFSGKIEYELDDKNKYEVYRDFRKKNPKIFNAKMENISKEFNIDKLSGNEFFYEQTNVDEELFLSTVIVEQAETKLNKQDQTVLVQKISNLIGTGNDNVSYKRAIERINRRQLDEIGTERSREKPINIIDKKIQNLENEKKGLEVYENKKYDIEEDKNNLKKEIESVESENNFLKELKLIFEDENLEKEKIKIKENIKNENNEKINIVENKINKLKSENIDILEMDFENGKSNKKINHEKNELNKKIIVIFSLIVLINILQFIFINNKIFNYIFFLTALAFLIFSYFLKKKLNKKIDEKEKITQNNRENYEEIKKELNNLEYEKNILEKNNDNFEKELINLRNNLNLEINLQKEKIKNKYLNEIEKNKINNLINSKNINMEIENLQKEINNKKIELNKLELEQKNIELKLENLPKIEEELINNNEQMKTLRNDNLSFNLAKQILEEAYEEMKENVIPKFTRELSNMISKITGEKYNNTMFNEEGLIVELNSGNYIPVSKLSIGTIDQLYLSLRFSMIEELSKEKLPIILDETFAYYDGERLKNILEYIKNRFEKNQIIIFTCTKREKDILDDLNSSYNFIEL